VNLLGHISIHLRGQETSVWILGFGTGKFLSTEFGWSKSLIASCSCRAALPVKPYYGGAICWGYYSELHDRDTCRRSCNSFSGYRSTTRGQQGPREPPKFEAHRGVPLEVDFLLWQDLKVAGEMSSNSR
jgi:hypothetical protein